MVHSTSMSHIFSFVKISLLAFLLIVMPNRTVQASETPEIFVQMGHGSVVFSVAFSPNGMYVLSAGGDTLKLWEVSSGREIRSFRGHTNSVRSINVSLDGKYVLSGSWDKTLKLWEIQSGKEIRTFRGHTGEVWTVALSPDGRYALSGGKDNSVKLWDVASGRELRTMNGHSNMVRSVVFSPNGRYALSGCDDKTIRFWDLSSGRIIRTFQSPKEIMSVAFSPDGNYLLSGGWDNVLKLWDLSSGRMIKTYQGHADHLDAVAFSPDGRYALSGGYEKILKLWNVSSGSEIKTFRGHTGDIRSVTFSPDGKYALSGGSDQTVKLWEVSSGREIKTFRGNAVGSMSAILTPDGKNVLTGGYDKTIKIWDASSGRFIRSFKGEASLMYVSPDGKYLLSAYRNFMKLWDLSNGSEVRSFEVNAWSNDVQAVSFSPDGRYALSGSSNRLMKLWDVSNGWEIRTFEGHDKSISAVAFSPDGKYALSASDEGGGDNTMILWELSNGKSIRTFRGHTAGISSVHFTPDSKYIISGSRDETIRIWDASNGQELRRFSRRTSQLDAIVAVSPNARLAAFLSNDQATVKLLDLTDGREMRTFDGNVGFVRSLVFSPDGKYLLCGRSNGLSEILEVASGHVIVQMTSFTDGEWVTVTPKGYFNASANGAKHLNVRVGNEIYAIDNFYEKFFNPVYVASVLQGKEVKVLADIRKGVLIPPEVRITSPKPNTSSNTDSIRITVTAQDKGGGIDEIRLYQNGKALGEEARGLQVLPKDNIVERTFTVTLVDGLNNFRAIGFSKDRTESNPYELIVKLTAPQKETTLHLFAVGLNKYRNPALNLSYAEPDAKGIIAFFRQKGRSLFKDVKVTEVYNDKATKATIIAKLADMQRTSPQDVVLIYLAGHGETIDDKWYFIPHELTYPEREEAVKKQGISSEELARFMKEIKAQKVLVLIDACKAGAVLLALRGFEDRKALSQLSRSTGVHIIAASTKNQFAAEAKEIGHGVFTYTLLEGLKGAAAGGTDTVTVRKLMGYVEERLPEVTKKYRREAQYPVVDSRGMDFPLVFLK